MTTPKEMRSAVEWFKDDDLFSEFIDHEYVGKWIGEVQADALVWAADQIRLSHSMAEAVMRLSLKHQELTKAKK